MWLVDLSQRHAPATLELPRAAATAAVLRIAHSRAFEERLRARVREAGRYLSGRVLVFSVEAGAVDFAATSLSFHQGGAGFRPRVDDPGEIGWVDAVSGAREWADRRLGYVVLPVFFDVSRPLAIFWDDAVVATTLRN